MDVTISSYEGTQSLRMKTNTVEAHTPTHFILLLDTSDSMNVDNKLDYVKFCSTLLLKLMTPADKMSIVTFGQHSRILLAAVSTDAAHCSVITETIASLQTNGCTNLSAGFASASEVLALDTTLKPMLLLLTDGHANRGISDDAGLQQMMNRIMLQFPTTGFSVIGYGTDHNAELLKSFAVDARGGYSIVGGLEDAALAMGESLGSAMSCVAQNVEILCSPGDTVEGPYSCVDGRIRIGDLYGGTESLLLIKAEGPVTVKGIYVPSMVPFSIEAIRNEAGRQADVELTSLRYECSRLFSAVGRWESEDQAKLVSDIEQFRGRLIDPFLANNPLTSMLMSELQSLDVAVVAMRDGGNDSVEAQIQQHGIFTSSGRGVTRPIQPDYCESVSAEDPRAHMVMSPMSSRAQRRVASLMQTMSQEEHL